MEVRVNFSSDLGLIGGNICQGLIGGGGKCQCRLTSTIDK